MEPPTLAAFQYYCCKFFQQPKIYKTFSFRCAVIWSNGNGRPGKVEWGKVYMLPRIVTIESSLRSFQYKILNNILYLNERLFKFNIVDSPLCSLCGAYNESIKHIFCTCTVTQSLWDQLRSWLYKVISFPISEPKTVILGLPSETTSNYILINHIILLFKRFIFVKRKEKNILALMNLTGISLRNVPISISNYGKR